ncbi:MAG TPA: nitrite/sulfite reductase [Symbiobacteriaceae bacterium]
MSQSRVETPAERVNRIKREKNPLAILPDIERYAKLGFDAIDKDDLEVRFRAWGLYTQGDGQGARGSQVPYFLLRIRIPGGQLRAHQVRRIADLSEQYARGTLDLTDRQNVQLHYVRIEDVPAIFRTLWEIGLTSQGACGDLVRNVTTCPLAGLEPGELYDTSGLVRELDRMLNGNPAFSDLPRKFKITVTGCPSWCTYPEINDIGLTVVTRRRGRRTEVGFALRVGGGLASRPHLARLLDAFIHPHQVPAVVQAVVSIFRDAEGLRANRAKARMKFLFLDHGWDEKRFLEEIEARLGYRLEPGVPHQPPCHVHRDHVGIHPQKQKGLYYAGFCVTGGRLTPWQYRLLADLAEEFGDGSIRHTIGQNLVIPNIREDRLEAFRKAAEAVQLPLEPSPFRRGIVACTGSQYCKLALTETKQFSEQLTAELERRLPGFGGQVKIHVNGCPNSCGQHWIADIGLQGVRIKQGEETVDGYEFFLGGGVAGRADIARRIPFRVPATEVADAVERVLRAYLAERQEGEVFQDYVRRHTAEELKAILAGERLPQPSGDRTEAGVAD